MPDGDSIGEGGRWIDGALVASAMPRRYVALRRVVNVGRTGAAAMSDLIANCAGLSWLLCFSSAPEAPLRCSQRGRNSRPETVRHLPAALGELRHDLPVQPHIHFGGAVERAGIA
jgi:hypothetical protein